MDLHTLKPAKGSTKNRKRIARGQASGSGGTAGRGHKGAKSRSGYSRKRAFEGGQMPLQMRLPKRGFKSPNRVEYVPMNLGQLQAYADKHGVTEITLEFLREKNIIKKRDHVKVLGNGELTGALTVEAHKASESAQKAVEAAGGSVKLV